MFSFRSPSFIIRPRFGRARRQGASADVDVPRGEVEAAAAAVGAFASAPILRELLAHRRRFGLAPAPLEVRHDAFPRVTALRAAAPGVEIAEVDALLATAP